MKKEISPKVMFFLMVLASFASSAPIGNLFSGTPGIKLWDLALIFAFIVPTAIVFYNEFYLARLSIESEYAKDHMHLLFTGALTHLRKIAAFPNIRMNIMVTGKTLFRKNRRMKMLYWTENTPDCETEQIWEEKQGCCGWALYDNEQVVYDSNKNRDLREHMTPTQVELTKKVKSILSTPIYHPKDTSRKKPIAMFNIDSPEGITRTQFEEKEIMDFAAKFSTIFSNFIPSHKNTD